MKTKRVTINIKAEFGSKFQEQFARDSLLGIIKAWQNYVLNAHKNNKLEVKVNDVHARHLEWFNWEKE